VKPKTNYPIGVGRKPSYRVGADERYFILHFGAPDTKAHGQLSKELAHLGLVGRHRWTQSGRPLTDHSTIHRDVKEMRAKMPYVTAGKENSSKHRGFNSEDHGLGQKKRSC